LPSFQDMMNIHEQFRLKDRLQHQEWLRMSLVGPEGADIQNDSIFLWFLNNNQESCDKRLMQVLKIKAQFEP